jgi:hypothetical protein
MKKILMPLIFAALACGPALRAQTSGTQGEEPVPTGSETGQEPEGQQPGPRPPKHPIMEALDKNRDHTLDEQEIADAAEALKTLDKNNDGELTQEEIRPPRPDKPQNSETGGDQPMSKSEQRRQEKEMRREARNPDQQAQGPGQGSQGSGRQGPPPPPRP